MTVIETLTSAETRAADADGTSVAFNQLAKVIQSKADHEPVREKISVRHLNFYYQDGNHALKDVSVPIYANRVTAFIGPSGCGKSTLLRVFNRVYSLYAAQRAEGKVLLDGEDILSRNQDVAVLRTRVGMVFQKPTPFPMSIYDNIAFGIGLNRSLTKAQMDNEAEVALRRAALWEEVKDGLLKSDWGCQVVSSSVSALRAPSQLDRKSFCSTSHAQLSIRFLQKRSSIPLMSSSTTTRSSS